MQAMYYIGLDVSKAQDQLLLEGQQWQVSLRRIASITWLLKSLRYRESKRLAQ